MAASCVTLSLTVMMLFAAHKCSGQSGDLDVAKVIAAMEGVSHTLECFGDMMKQNSDAMTSLQKLPEMMLQVKEQLREQTGNIDILRKEVRVCNGEALTSEIEDLKKQLESKDEQVRDLQEKLAEIHQKVEQHSGNEKLLKDEVQDLKEKLQESLQQVTNHSENEDSLKNKVQDLEEKIEENRQTVEQTEKLLKNEVEKITEENKRLKTEKAKCTAKVEKLEGKSCKLAKGNKIREQVQKYNTTKDWRKLRRSLEEILDHNTAAYKQLQDIGYSETGAMFDIGNEAHRDLLEVLVLCGSAVNVGDGLKDTLLFGTTEDSVELTKWLLAHGADIEARNVYGDTPLTLAAYNGQLGKVKLLVESGASTTAKTNTGSTALDCAVMKGRTTVVKYLSKLPH